jgi:hypothetical protein
MRKIIRFRKMLCLSLVIICLLGSSLASLPANAITSSTKEQTYEEYQKIIEDAKEKYDAQIYLLPIDQINESDMLSPEEFKDKIDKIVNEKIDVKVNNDVSGIIKTELYAYGYGTTKVYDDSDDSYTIKIACDCYTEYNSVAGREVFNRIQNINSSSNACDWNQEGSESYTFDGNRSACIKVSGTFTVAGMKFTKTASITLNCSSDGNVTQE